MQTVGQHTVSQQAHASRFLPSRLPRGGSRDGGRAVASAAVSAIPFVLLVLFGVLVVSRGFDGRASLGAFAVAPVVILITALLGAVPIGRSSALRSLREHFDVLADAAIELRSKLLSYFSPLFVRAGDWGVNSPSQRATVAGNRSVRDAEVDHFAQIRRELAELRRAVARFAPGDRGRNATVTQRRSFARQRRPERSGKTSAGPPADPDGLSEEPDGYRRTSGSFGFSSSARTVTFRDHRASGHLRDARFDEEVRP
jgi:hypothetical protein